MAPVTRSVNVARIRAENASGSTPAAIASSASSAGRRRSASKSVRVTNRSNTTARKTTGHGRTPEE
jgi:hypothetical protein